LQLAQRLEVGQPLEEEDALGQPIGVLHLVDRFLVLVLRPAPQPPVLEHLGVQEILVDRGQFVVERLVEELDDLLVALHAGASFKCTAHTLPLPPKRWRNANHLHPEGGPAPDGTQAASSTTGSAMASETIPVAVSMQLPQLEPQPVRIISSDIPEQPAAAASRISESVIPWQRQTYKAQNRCGTCRILTSIENDCQFSNDSHAGSPSRPRPGAGLPPAPRSRFGRRRRVPRRGGSNLRNGIACGPATWRANGARCRSALA